MSFLKGNLYDKTDIDRERFMEKCAHFLNEHSIPLVKTVSALHFMYSALTQIILRVKRLCRASPSILQCLSDRQCSFCFPEVARWGMVAHSFQGDRFYCLQNYAHASSNYTYHCKRLCNEKNEKNECTAQSLPVSPNLLTSSTSGVTRNYCFWAISENFRFIQIVLLS